MDIQHIVFLNLLHTFHQFTFARAHNGITALEHGLRAETGETLVQAPGVAAQYLQPVAFIPSQLTLQFIQALPVVAHPP